MFSDDFIADDFKVTFYMVLKDKICFNGALELIKASRQGVAICFTQTYFHDISVNRDIISQLCYLPSVRTTCL